MQVSSSKLLAEKKPLMKKLLDSLLQKYTYASILGTDASAKNYGISASGISIFENEDFSEFGYVVKVYDSESYAEYAFNNLTEENMPSILASINEVLIPWKSSLPEGLSISNYEALEDEAICFEKSSEYQIDPTTLSDGAIIDKLSDLRNKTMAADANIKDAMTRFSYQVYHKTFLSKNKDITQNIMWSTSSIIGLGLRGQEMMPGFRSSSGNCGAEVLDLIETKIPEIVETVNDLLKSEPIIPGEYDCICTPEVTGMIVHEAFGHGVEMDMFAKKRALAEKYIGEYVASPLVTMHDGAAAANETATFFFDDEGTMAQDTIIIDKGILKQGICDAQAALALSHTPTGNGRRQSTSHKAYTRMTNTFFELGTDRLEDMIASIDYGFLLSDASSGMEDPKNWGIQCMVSIAREIKDGKFTGKVFSPIVLTGYVPDLLKSISMMSDNTVLSGSGMCGKGYKEWVKVSDGGPYIKAKIRLG